VEATATSGLEAATSRQQASSRPRHAIHTLILSQTREPQV
jgi:hypothetical protein